MAFHCVDFNETSSQQLYLEIFNAKVHPNWSRNAKRAGIYSFTISGKVHLSLTEFHNRKALQNVTKIRQFSR
jgi:hypothetical protein